MTRTHEHRFDGIRVVDCTCRQPNAERPSSATDGEQTVIAWGAIVLTVFIIVGGLGLQVCSWISP